MKKKLIVLLLIIVLFVSACGKKETLPDNNQEEEQDFYVGAFYSEWGKYQYTLFLRKDKTFRILEVSDDYVNRVGTYTKNGNDFVLTVTAVYDDNCFYKQGSGKYNDLFKPLTASIANNKIIVNDNNTVELTLAEGVYEVDDTLAKYSAYPEENEFHKDCTNK